MTENSVYIILASPAIGGVEKRLAGLFLHLVAHGQDVRLVISRELLEQLRRSREHSGVDRHATRIHPFDGGADSFRALGRHLRPIFTDAPRGVFHYGLASPLRLHRSRSKRTLFTIPNASLTQYNARGLAEVYGGILRATRVDVLDPAVYAKLASRFPWRRGSFSLTPGSYVDLDLFKPLPGSQKRDVIAFCGLFSDEKQAPRLVSVLPQLLSRLDAAGFPDAQVWLLGRDPAGDVTRRVAELSTPRVRAWFDPDPRVHLSQAKVFLSLQRSTNHPSKALLEAMACGCTPIVTDTRDSRRSAPEHLAHYVPREFSADDLARAAIHVLRRTPAELDEHADRMRTFLAANFSLDTMAAYYAQLYDQLRALPG